MILCKDILFDWDEEKAIMNEAKHGISFVEAMTAFDDQNAIIINDDDHSIDEERFILLGITSNSKLLMVCHCYRSKEEIIRIINARRANKLEVINYERRLS